MDATLNRALSRTPTGRRCCWLRSLDPASWPNVASGNEAIPLLANTIVTGAPLVALIVTFGSISGPAVPENCVDAALT
jgi:hypothetical protein